MANKTTTSVANLKTAIGQGLLVFKQWQLKYQLTSLIIIAFILFYLWHGVALLIQANWQGLAMLGLVCMFLAWVANPESFFLPIRQSADINRQFLDQHSGLKKIQYFGLFLIFCYGVLRIAGMLGFN